MQAGGSIVKHPSLSKIISIGFELESPSISPCVLDYYGKVIHFTGSELEINTERKDISFIRGVDTTVVGVVSPLSDFEQHLQMNNQITVSEESEEKYTYRIKSKHTPEKDMQEVLHTEFKITFYEPELSNSILLNYCERAITAVLGYYSESLNVMISPAPINSMLYLCKMTHDMAIAIKPEFIDNVHADYILSIPDDIPWHIQCTIGVKLEDLVDVISYISVGNGYGIDSIKNLQQIYLDELQNPSVIDTNMCFLYAMFSYMKGRKLTKSGKKDYIFAVRHGFMEIYKYHYPNSSLPPIKERLVPELVFKSVRQYPYKGTILIELRDFYDQLIFTAFKEKSVGYDFGKPLNRLMEAVTKIKDM